MERRAVLGWMAVSAAVSGCVSAPDAAPAKKRTYVMVPGAYTGGWLYERIAPRLRAQGHTVFAPSFTGVAERRHLLSAAVDVNTHVADIVSLVEFENLKDVTLVAHSYAGIPATGAADQLGTARLRELIYIDALVPLDNMGWSDLHTDAQRTGNLNNLNGAGQGERLMDWRPAPKDYAVALGISEADAAYTISRQTPMPGNTYTSRVSLKNGGYTRFPRTYIECTDPALPTIAQTKARIRNESGWTMRQLKTGHMPMFSMPDPLLAILTA
jgi:pimeloyl-ACP methyl ester carboxylesterase